jgi:outer membrane protein OmpA-like peptidoglycan-associated protein/outer membrane protein W
MFPARLRIKGQQSKKKYCMFPRSIFMAIVDSKSVKSKSSLRRGALVIAVVLACGSVTTPVLGQSADTAVTFDIPAQPLGTALNSLAIQADLQIFFEQEPVAGLQSPAINGSMTAKQALASMLANTQLKFAQNTDGTLVVSQKVKLAAKPVAHPPTVAAVAPAAAVITAPVTPLPQSARDSEGAWMIRARALYLEAHNKSDAFFIPGAPPSLVPENGARSNDRWTPELDAEYFFNSHWSSELAVTFPQTHDLLLNTAAGGSGKVGTFRLMPNFLTLKYNFLPDAVFRPYLGLGVNVTSFYGDDAGPYRLSKTTGGVAAQGGFDIKLSDHWFFNADVKFARARPVVDFDDQRMGHLKVDPLLFGLGIGYRFGGSPAVATPVAAPVPPPPPAPLDSDGDGVPDTLDQCPNTPRGVQVDGRGCPLDSDNDGVADYLDQCPGTPAGLKVDANGCEIEEMVLTGVTFETASAILTAQSSEVLDKVAAVLRQRPQSTAEIHGYTDNRGSDAYNQKLSERRAAAVVAYLMEHGIPGAHLSSKGLGKSNPVATNDTAEGRAQNRRVTVEFSRSVPR